MLSLFKTKISMEGNLAIHTRVNNISQVYLVDSPMTPDWVESQTISCDPKIGYLVFQNNQFTYCSRNYASVIEEKRLSQLFMNTNAGWSTKATLDDLVFMTDICPELSRELGDLVILMENGYDLNDYPHHSKREKKIGEIIASHEPLDRADSVYFKA